MKKYALAICDPDEEYVDRLQEFLDLKRTLPFKVYVFTDVHESKVFAATKHIDVAVVSEHFRQQSKELSVPRVIILTETEEAESQSIYKYRSGEHFISELYRICGEEIGFVQEAGGFGGTCTLISFYSPIKRCLQTSTVLVMGQVLARRHKVLYLNFESYAGFEGRISEPAASDLSDLIYYQKNLKEHFRERFLSTVKVLNGMDYIPPALSFMDIGGIEPTEWLEFLAVVSEGFDYEYILLDLSDLVRGLPDVMRQCERIYTIMGRDLPALSKQAQYEKLMASVSYSDVLDKTKKLEIPLFQGLNVNMDKLMYSDLSEYVRKLVKEDIEKDSGGVRKKNNDKT